MPSGTTDNPQPNPQMRPSPGITPPQPDNRGQEQGNPLPNPEHRTGSGATRPGGAYSDYPQQRDPMFDDPQRRDPSHRHDHAAASTAWDERLRNPSEPWLPDDYDKALVARVYQDVDSGDELRKTAYEAAREVYRLAAEATASVDVPIPGVPDQRDPRTKAREGLRPGVQRALPPNMPRQGNPDNRPEQTTPPDQPPGPQDLGPDHAQGDVQRPQGGQQGGQGGQQQHEQEQRRQQEEQQRRQQQEQEQRQQREKEEQDKKNKGSHK